MKFKKIALWAVLALGCLVFSGQASQAGTIITVNGKKYEIFLSAAAEPFTSYRSPLVEASPWWGVSNAVALDYALAFQAAAPPSVQNFSGNSIDIVQFGVSVSGHTVFGAWSGENGTSGTGGLIDETTTYPNAKFASGVAIVPEIDAPALYKTLFALFALGLWMFARRTRFSRLA